MRKDIGGKLMITLEINLDKNLRKVQIKDAVLFNAILSRSDKLIKKIIKSVDSSYVINNSFFEIINNFIDFDDEGVSLYGGLIVRTSLEEYAVLFLEHSNLDEEYMLSLINQYIKDVGDHIPKEVNVYKFEVQKEVFLQVIKNM